MRIWTLSNAISFIRLLLTIPVVLLAASPIENRAWILAVTLLVYISDLSDGYIARRFNQESEFGRMIDPLADKIFVGAFAVALTIAGAVPLWFLIAALARDGLILLGGIVIQRRTKRVVQSNIVGKVTVVTIGICLLASLFQDQIRADVFTALLIVSTTAMVVSLISYGRRAADAVRSS